MNSRLQLLGVLALATACTRDPIDVHKDTDAFDFGRGELLAAVDAAAADPTSPKVIATLAARIEELRPQFNDPVAKEAERKLVFLALFPLESQFTEPVDEQLEALGLTVWPIALRVAPEKGETARSYASRVCSTTLALECKYAVPEYWPVILSSVVWRRMQERAREAYVRCGPCKSEPGQSYDKALERYRGYQTAVGARAAAIRTRAHPNRWPRAGEHALDWDAKTPLLELLDDGSAEFRGEGDGSAWRRMVREKRNGAEVLGVHVVPSSDVQSLRSVLADARKAGYTFVDLQVRAGDYPYALKRYRLSLGRRGKTTRVKVSPDDSIQLLVQALDVQSGLLAKKGSAAPAIFSL